MGIAIIWFIDLSMFLRFFTIAVLKVWASVTTDLNWLEFTVFGSRSLLKVVGESPITTTSGGSFSLFFSVPPLSFSPSGSMPFSGSVAPDGENDKGGTEKNKEKEPPE